jgi:hypothetical protein
MLQTEDVNADSFSSVRLEETRPVDASQAAARLLEIVTNNADQLLAETKAEAEALLAAAKAEADQVTAAARTEAEQLTASSRAEADQVTAAAHAEARQTLSDLEERRVAQNVELDAHRTSVLNEVADRKAELEAEVTHLLELQHDHREWMRGYFTQQLEHLNDLAGPSTVAESSHTED